jgi:hypothetical protein
LTSRRLSTLNLTNDYVPFGVDMLSAVSAKVNGTGYVTQVVNPYDFTQQGAESAEAQSFVLMAYAAYNEWDKMGQPGNTAKGDPLGKDSGAVRPSWSLGAIVVAGLAAGGGWLIL